MANFIVCLAHFCELHGPSSIICTQICTREEKDQYILPSTSKLQTCASCKLHLPGENANLTTSGDSGSHTMFISTQYPTSQSRFVALTKLIMKSLSVETSSDITKPMFFGGTVYGYCIHKIFKIKDPNARGSERKYSLMVISDEELDLVKNWNIVNLYLTEIISLIQKQVDLTVENNLNNPAESTGILDERYLRRAVVKPKSLLELTGDPQIFVKFHLWAVELLTDICK